MSHIRVLLKSLKKFGSTSAAAGVQEVGVQSGWKNMEKCPRVIQLERSKTTSTIEKICKSTDKYKHNLVTNEHFPDLCICAFVTCAVELACCCHSPIFVSMVTLNTSCGLRHLNSRVNFLPLVSVFPEWLQSASEPSTVHTLHLGLPGSLLRTTVELGPTVMSIFGPSVKIRQKSGDLKHKLDSKTCFFSLTKQKFLTSFVFNAETEKTIDDIPYIFQ